MPNYRGRGHSHHCPTEKGSPAQREQNVSSHPQHKSERNDRFRTPSLTGSPPCPVTQCNRAQVFPKGPRQTEDLSTNPSCLVVSVVGTEPLQAPPDQRDLRQNPKPMI